jgi:nicotinate-nucleotide adenylyltransferase
MKTMRIAFFGGSFDPPHLGHARIAQAAADRLHLDRVLLAPVALQPLKRETPAPASWPERLAMLRLLLADLADPRFQPSELDAPRPDGKANYTYDTLIDLKQQLAPSDELFVLLGADSFLSMHHWHRAPDLLLAANWIIAARPGFDLQSPDNPLRLLDHALPPSIHAAAGTGSEPSTHSPALLHQHLQGPDGRQTDLYVLPDMREDISATEIRAAFAEGCTKQDVLSTSVVHYIRTHHLYG